MFALFLLETCRCHKKLTTNYRQYTPYVNVTRVNQLQPLTTDDLKGMLPFLFSDLATTCCRTCKQHGTTLVDLNNNGKNMHAFRQHSNEVESFIDNDTDFSFPIYGLNWQRVYKSYYRYIPLVESPGIAFIVITADYVDPVWTMYKEIVATWPYVLFTVLTALVAGIIVWFLVSKTKICALLLIFSYYIPLFIHPSIYVFICLSVCLSVRTLCTHIQPFSQQCIHLSLHAD